MVDSNSTVQNLELMGGYVDLQRREMVKLESVIKLTEIETRLLGFLACHPGQTIEKSRLLANVWGYEKSVQTRTLTTTLCRLREKIEIHPGKPDHLHTIRGRGIAFNPLESKADWRVAADRRYAHASFGREREIRLLDAQMNQGMRLLLLEGEPGIGKSRLAHLLAHFRQASEVFHCELHPTLNFDVNLLPLLSALGIPFRWRSRGVKKRLYEALHLCKSPFLIFNIQGELTNSILKRVQGLVDDIPRLHGVITCRSGVDKGAPMHRVEALPPMVISRILTWGHRSAGAQVWSRKIAFSQGNPAVARLISAHEGALPEGQVEDGITARLKFCISSLSPCCQRSLYALAVFCHLPVDVAESIIDSHWVKCTHHTPVDILSQLKDYACLELYRVEGRSFIRLTSLLRSILAENLEMAALSGIQSVQREVLLGWGEVICQKEKDMSRFSNGGWESWLTESYLSALGLLGWQVEPAHLHVLDRLMVVIGGQHLSELPRGEVDILGSAETLKISPDESLRVAREQDNWEQARRIIEGQVNKEVGAFASLKWDIEVAKLQGYLGEHQRAIQGLEGWKRKVDILDEGAHLCQWAASLAEVYLLAGETAAARKVLLRASRTLIRRGDSDLVHSLNLEIGLSTLFEGELDRSEAFLIRSRAQMGEDLSGRALKVEADLLMAEIALHRGDCTPSQNKFGTKFEQRDFHGGLLQIRAALDRGAWAEAKVYLGQCRYAKSEGEVEAALLEVRALYHLLMGERDALQSCMANAQPVYSRHIYWQIPTRLMMVCFYYEVGEFENADAQWQRLLSMVEGCDLTPPLRWLFEIVRVFRAEQTRDELLALGQSLERIDPQWSAPTPFSWNWHIRLAYKMLILRYERLSI